MKQVCVLGSGAFGTAVATVLAHNGHRVKLWCYESEVAQEIVKDRRNHRYLPEVVLDERIEPVIQLEQALKDAVWVLEAVPVKFLRSVLQQCSPFFKQEQIWVMLSKGIEQKTILFPSQIIEDVFGTHVRTAVMAGPSFAKDLADKKITGVTVAAKDETFARALQELLANDYLRPYTSTDVLGVQVGGALKNVVTLGIGMLDGAGYTDNTKAFLFTRGLQEMVLCARAVGADERTLYSFSGIGDLVLTSMGVLSRNLAVGKRLGMGQHKDEILKDSGLIPEGINTLVSVCQLAEQHNLDLPVFRGLHDVVFGGKTVAQLLQELVARPLQDE